MNLPAPRTASKCGNCSLTGSWFSHDVNLRGTERRLCTSCVLLLHPSSFCPSCFEFFDNPLSATSTAASNRFISCIKCSSLTHLRCLPSSTHPSPSSFLCPPCSSPFRSSFSFFPIHTTSLHQLDASLASILLCAAKIAAASITKAHSVARAKADRSVRESAAARKRAKEALDHLTAIEIARCATVEGSMEVSGSRNLGIRKVLKSVNSNGLSENKNGFRGNNNGTAANDDEKLERVQSNNSGR